MTKLWLPSAGFCNVRVDHLRRIDEVVDFVFRDKPQFQGGLFEGEVVVQCVVRDLRGYALDNDLTLKQAALKLGFVTEDEFDRVVDPAKMVHPYVAKEIGRASCRERV